MNILQKLQEQYVNEFNANIPLDEFLFEDKIKLAAWVYQSLMWFSVVTLIAFFLANRFYRLSRSLKREIVSRERLQQELIELAETDPLSNLANRRKLEQKAEEEIIRCQRYQHGLALVLFDLNLFKDINDKWGHACGDRCIKTLSQLCQVIIRDSDIAARIGGDEFALLLPEISVDSANVIVERIRQAVLAADLFNDQGEQIRISASFGLAMLGNSSDSYEAMFSRADKAMYQEKNTTREAQYKIAAGTST